MCHKMAYKMEEAVGDSSNNRVANFQRCARELLRSALLEQYGSVNQSEAARSKVTKQRDMIRKKEKLLKKKTDAATELELRRSLSIEPLCSVSVSEDEAYVDAVRQRIKSLEDELLATKAEHRRDCQLLECLHRGHVLREELFGDGLSRSSLKDSGTVVELARQDELSEAILKEVEGREKVRKELATLRKQRIEVQQKSRRLMDAVPGGTDQQQSTVDSVEEETQEESMSTDREDERLARVENEVCLLRHTLQGLIAGSKVCWSEDKELLELTLKLGDDERWT